MKSSISSHNNFGVLRVAFATMVVLSHAPELVDGDRSRELLTRLFGTLSFGELGVDGFFLISGYLITKSFETSSSVFNYLRKRVARIYPAFVVATLLSIVFFAPLSGTPLTQLGIQDWELALKSMALLQTPSVPAFPGTHYPALNGSMWTIAYEFRCYLLIAALGLAGVLRHREYVLAVAAVFVLMLAAKIPTPIPASNVFYGNPPDAIRLTAAFLSGSVFYLYRDVISFRTAYVAFAATVLFFCMFVPRLAEPVLFIFGGYLIFWLAFVVSPIALRGLTTRYDISYGLYLYAWPIQSMFVFFRPGLSLWKMFVASLFLSLICGLLSWLLIERRAQAWAHKAFSQGPDIHGPVVLTESPAIEAEGAGLKPRAFGRYRPNRLA
ncbi:acyltransferase family protein [Bradyrhizobium genosp. P]|uniref:acyltransferase family protein n=1 Tax=Bradyrhizobium genosp. P TaxID=83641 RepID=UPI003CF89869